MVGLSKGKSQVVPSLGILRVDAQRLAIGIDLLIGLAGLSIDNPQVVPSTGKLGVDAQHLAIGLDRLFGLAGLSKGKPQEEPSQAATRVCYCPSASVGEENIPVFFCLKRDGLQQPG